jgi:hypothetical protein
MRRPAALALIGCSLVLLSAGCNFAGDQTLAEKLESGLAKRVTLEGGGRVECQMMAGKLWSCRVEADPGSGWSGSLHLRVDKAGCWRARRVWFEKPPYSKGLKSDLSRGNFRARGRTIRGCTQG